jgi:hypothetical protein
MSFATITLCVTSQRVFIVALYFVIDSVRKLLDTPSYATSSDEAYKCTENFDRKLLKNVPFGRPRRLEGRL